MGRSRVRAAVTAASTGIVPLFRSPVTLAVSSADFSLPSLHPKIPFPAAVAKANTVRQPGNIGSFGRPKARRFEPGP
jgi:hypothetical protein